MGKNHSRLSHHPATFYDHRHCGSGDIFLVCHVISQKHVAIWSFDFMGKRVRASHHPDKFFGHRYCGSGNVMVLICHVISQGHVIERCGNIVARSPLWLVTNLPSFVAISIVVVKI